MSREIPTPNAIPYTMPSSFLLPQTWLVWLMTSASVAIMAHNPLYSLLLLLVGRMVYLGTRPRGATIPFRWLRLGVIMLTISTVLYGLSLHSGDTVLFRLPGSWPLVGGPITGEAMILGASNGLHLLTLLVLFATFNRAVPSTDLIRLTPRALHHLGIVVLIALTYVPETLNQWQRIREAQAIRGYVPKGWRGWRPLLLPLLVSGLERAMEVAEAMVARGYGATANQGQPVVRQGVMVIGLAAAFVGWLLFFAQPLWGSLLLLAGVLLLLWLLWQAGRDVPFTRYQATSWQQNDFLVMGLSCLPLLALFWITPTSLTYSPFPQVALPPFHPLFGASLLAFLAPWLSHDTTPSP
ncbi:MAG: energy-coupling factor transporter transmembrane protein EcfT [Chloroflexi bacterium]|nr:energy-coupling factor transporter transmembrane protein EcfT [Chloroflexota bacterium]MBP8055317.1 energy-coupling factor transporter transmembrane protein EcfT [Chloroflexota bacterium]